MSDFPDRLRTAGTLYSAALEDGQKHEELLYLASYHIEQLEAERQWISVDDELPEPGEIVIVDGGCAHHESDGWYTHNEPGVYSTYRAIQWQVTHWMPLPPPPEKEA